MSDDLLTLGERYGTLKRRYRNASLNDETEWQRIKREASALGAELDAAGLHYGLEHLHEWALRCAKIERAARNLHSLNDSNNPSSAAGAGEQQR